MMCYWGGGVHWWGEIDTEEYQRLLSVIRGGRAPSGGGRPPVGAGH